MGTFYELYEADATVANKHFGLTITYTGSASAGKSVPEAKLESFCLQLVALAAESGRSRRYPTREVARPPRKASRRTGSFVSSSRLEPILAPARQRPACCHDCAEGRTGACCLDAAAAKLTLYEFEDDSEAAAWPSSRDAEPPGSPPPRGPIPARRAVSPKIDSHRAWRLCGVIPPGNPRRPRG